MNSTYIVHNSNFCLPKSTNAGQEKKKKETQHWKTWTQDSFESKRPLCLEKVLLSSFLEPSSFSL